MKNKIRILIDQARESGTFSSYNLILGFAEFVFIIIAVTVLQNIYKNEIIVHPGVTITNFENSGIELSKDSTTIDKIYSTVRLNTNSSISENAVEVREDSVKRSDFLDGGVKYESFIVDIAEIQQSYQVIYFTSTDSRVLVTSNPTMVVCLPEDRQIYNFKDCNDEFDNEGYYVLLQRLSKIAPSNNRVDYNYRYSVGDKNVKITSVSCGVDNGRQETLDNMTKFIESLDFRISDINYSIDAYCDN